MTPAPGGACRPSLGFTAPAPAIVVAPRPGEWAVVLVPRRAKGRGLSSRAGYVIDPGSAPTEGTGYAIATEGTGSAIASEGTGYATATLVPRRPKGRATEGTGYAIASEGTG